MTASKYKYKVKIQVCFLSIAVQEPEAEKYIFVLLNWHCGILLLITDNSTAILLYCTQDYHVYFCEK